MIELLRLFAQIALQRRGPQDVPASSVLLTLTVVGYFAVNALVSLVLPPLPGVWLPQLVIEALFMLVWYAVLLRVAKRPERFLQTATAMFGYQLVLAPLWIAAVYVARRYNDETILQFAAAIIGMAIAIWVIRAGAYVLKAALELPTIVCVGLILLEILASQFVLLAIVPSGPNLLNEPTLVAPDTH